MVSHKLSLVCCMTKNHYKRREGEYTESVSQTQKNRLALPHAVIIAIVAGIGSTQTQRRQAGGQALQKAGSVGWGLETTWGVLCSLAYTQAGTHATCPQAKLSNLLFC